MTVSKERPNCYLVLSPCSDPTGVFPVGEWLLDKTLQPVVPQCTGICVHCTLYTVHCTLYSVQCTVYKWDKVVELVGGGSVINRATMSSF